MVRLGLVIYSADAEKVWNAFRLGVLALKEGDEVSAFLLAKGVECDRLDTPAFPVTAQMREFLDRGGRILACGTCLKLRAKEETELCPLSGMADLYRLVRECDRVLTF